MARSQLAIQSSVEVLAPELDLNAQLAKVVKVEEIFNNCFIPTDRASVSVIIWDACADLRLTVFLQDIL